MEAVQAIEHGERVRAAEIGRPGAGNAMATDGCLAFGLPCGDDPGFFAGPAEQRLFALKELLGRVRLPLAIVPLQKCVTTRPVREPSNNI